MTTRPWHQGTRQWALWSTACAFWLVVFVLGTVTHTWLGAGSSGGLAAISGYRSYRAFRAHRNRATH